MQVDSTFPGEVSSLAGIFLFYGSSLISSCAFLGRPPLRPFSLTALAFFSVLLLPPIRPARAFWTRKISSLVTLWAFLGLFFIVSP